MDCLSSAQRSVLKKLREDTGHENLDIHPEITVTAMDARYSKSSTRVAISALRKLYPDSQFWIDLMQKRMPEYKKIDTSQEPTKKQIDAYIDWDDIIKFRDSDNKLNALDMLLIGLYTYIEPQRLDYTPMRIVNRKPRTPADGTNYLIVNSTGSKFLFHAYKTAKSYGDRLVPVPPELHVLIIDYIHDRRSGFLFQDATTPWTATRLGQNVRRIFQKHFNKDFGVNNLRHSFITKINAGMPSLAHLSDTASKMGHDIITHQTYRHIALEP